MVIRIDLFYECMKGVNLLVCLFFRFVRWWKWVRGLWIIDVIV